MDKGSDNQTFADYENKIIKMIVENQKSSEQKINHLAKQMWVDICPNSQNQEQKKPKTKKTRVKRNFDAKMNNQEKT